jgi:hypothetical protein
MEVRKANQQIIQTEIPQNSEVTKTKNAVQKLISDSFEKENSKSSDSNASSSASSEPEKKAGQITNGILIKQMTTARIGETNAKQSAEVSGKKDLSPEEQARVSNSVDPQKKDLKPSSSLQDARSRYEDRKNSGLQAPFAPKKGEPSEQQAKVNQSIELAKDLIGQDAKVQDGSQKDFSNDPLISGKNAHDAVKDETDNRQKDTNALGGSKNDRLATLLNPTSSSPQQSGPAHNQSMISYDLAEQCIKDGLITREEYEKAKAEHKDTPKAAPATPEEPKAPGQSEKPKVSDILINIVTSLPGVFLPRGIVTPPVPPDPETGKNVMRGIKAIGESKDRTPESETLKGSSSDDPKSYTQENYTGNIPDAVKKTEEYFKQQIISQKPSSGGETAHTDDSASNGTITGGSVSNFVVQQGIGGLSNPGSRENPDGGTTGTQGHLGSQSGGNVDFGQDSDQSGYTGVTHQDDPGDVQFGSQEPVVKDGVESKNSNDDKKDSNDLSDILNPKRRRSVN